MQTKNNRYSLFAAFMLFSLLLTTSVFASSSAPVHFEQQMNMALSLWYAQHPETLPASLTPMTNAASGSIEGMIRHDRTPIAGAEVFCWALFSDNIVTQSVVSDADGKYKLEGLAAGDYFVVAAAAGYGAAFYGGGASPLDADVVTVGETAVTGIDIKLEKMREGSGSISGTVTGDAGPIAGAWVVAHGKGNTFSVKNTFAISDENGAYAIGSLPRGLYIVAVYANGYIPEVYDDATSLTDIDLVTVNDTAVIGVDFLLDPGGAISGHIADNSGAPLAGVKVTAHAPKELTMPGGFSIPGLSRLTQTARTDANGDYRITGLATGQYKVSAAFCVNGIATIIFYDNKKGLDEADPVAVTQGAETTGINFTLAVPTAKISGLVTDQNGTPLEGIYVYYVREGDDVYYNFGRLWKTSVTDANGFYEIKNLDAGTFYVSAWFWDWMNFKGIWYENADSLKNATPIVLADGETRADINMTLDLTSDYGSISGTVTLDSTGEPVGFAFVQAVPIKSQAHSFLHKRFPTIYAFTDASGNYTLNPVFKGDYYVIVRANNHEEFYDDAPTRAEADTVKVLPGEDTIGINFGVPPAPAGSMVTGIVTDESTGEPIAGAFVAVFPSIKHRDFDGNLKRWRKVFYTTFTNDQGAYRIGGIPAGSYIAGAWARDYVAEFYDNAHNPFRATVIELDGTAAQEGVDMALTPRSGKRFADGPGKGRYGSIGGFIRGSDGQPVESAFVFAVDGQNDIVASEMAGEDGSYALNGLDEGSYTVMATRSLFETTFYPNVTDAGAAVVLEVSAVGQMEYADVSLTMTAGVVTAADADKANSQPADYVLAQNYPNPFNPSTVIEYRLPEAGAVTLQVFNVQGQLVKTLVNQFQSANSYSVTWDGTNASGIIQPSGIYLYQLRANDFTEVRQLVFMR